MVNPHDADAAAQSAPKLSRYRSVREGAQSRQPAEAPNGSTAPPAARVQSSTSEQNPSIARSMSRYRRSRPATTNGRLPSDSPTHVVVDHQRSHPKQDPGNTREGENEHRSTRHATWDSERPGIKSAAHENELAKERHRQNAMAQLTVECGPTSSVPGRLRPNEGAQPRSHKEQQGSDQQGASSVHASFPDASRKSFLQRVKLSRPKEANKSDHPTTKYIEVSGDGMAAGVDAPISAVNAGERRVTVQYGDGPTELAVTPSTLAEDILISAARHLSRDIEPPRFILMESFQQLGLERPLRRYERVRDVMNSWVRDGDNRLFIIPPSSMEALSQLDIDQVPSERPAETTVYLYHSQRPRKWDKRYVTLRSDGQVTISKKPDAKDPTNICHLSDFDVYYPNAQALAKDIKPPKKICYAIKSQQKSSMFLSTENFVHFFSTNDGSVADSWYQAVQKWRSWYLVNKLGAGQKEEEDASLLARSGTRKSTRRQKKDSPVLDRETGDTELWVGPSRSTGSKELFARKKSLREHAPPPSCYPKTLTVETGVGAEKGTLVQGMSTGEMDATTFSPNSLLGRTYSQRQRSMRERGEEMEKRATQDPFSPHGILAAGCSPTYPASQQHSRSNTFNQAAVSRSLSVHQQPKPLVDLTPIFHEPPQHTRKGRGVRMEPGMPLIDGATGPDLNTGSAAIPPATSWRRPPTDDRHQTSSVPGRSNTVRSTHHALSHAAAVASLTSSTNPFMPNSLLSSVRMPDGQGKAATGHGVATGDRNSTRPMLDMSPDSPFAEGSLLGRSS